MVTRPTATIQRIHPPKGRPVFYEDRIIDGRVPIEMMQSNAIKQVTSALDYLQDGEDFVFMDSNLPIRLDSDDLRVSIAPDYYRSKNVNVSVIRDDTGYNLWEIGKPPEWVLEVASRSTYRRDLYEKPGIYASIEVSELWMFDPTGGELYGQALMGFRLVDGEYEPIEIAENEHGLPSGYSEELGLRLCALEWSKREELLRIQPSIWRVIAGNFQPTQLLFQDTDTGLYILNMRALAYEYRRANAERQRAEAERQAERKRAEEAEAERQAERKRAEEAEAERQAERKRAEEAEAERQAERKRAEEAEAERQAERKRAEEAEAENARLRERIRRMEEN